MALAALIIVASSEDSFWIGLDWIGLDRRFSSAWCTALNADTGPSLWHIKTRNNKQQATSKQQASKQTNKCTNKQTTQDKQRHEQGSENSCREVPFHNWLA
ncbi:unnamed protein product [Polarella glacialis]|uniref:Uncharacterized protein n=1 Tax=Polarella glacialis TaxID=89957 RepID=A0A813EB33_POLGL|nr:unnamed protein product [Polarella glacialis]